jgi:hypothetical protein
MKSAQARASVETLREVQNDKALKTKAEKERRLREVLTLKNCFVTFETYCTHWPFEQYYFKLTYKINYLYLSYSNIQSTKIGFTIC